MSGARKAPASSRIKVRKGQAATPLSRAEFHDRYSARFADPAFEAEAEAIRAMFKQIAPLGRVGRPEEMAAAALFLASEDSSYSTGIDLVADGGTTQV